MLIHNVNTIKGDLTLYDSHIDLHKASSCYAARLVNNMFQCKVCLTNWGIKYPYVYEPVIYLHTDVLECKF